MNSTPTASNRRPTAGSRGEMADARNGLKKVSTGDLDGGKRVGPSPDGEQGAKNFSGYGFRQLQTMTILNARPGRDRCFAPIVSANAHTLILGSLPGRKSLEIQQYYAHPQNAFWKLIAQIFKIESPPPYAQRVKILRANRIALWDVLAAATRPGSLDSSIVHATAQANDFAAFFRAHPRIRRVLFNGRKAEELYRRFVLPGLSADAAALRYVSMPSTSPAHAGMTFAKKLERWRKELAP
ncbi:MAG: DNA-deoxyinosine glycosylase [Pseudomonadota bacterium]